MISAKLDPLSLVDPELIAAKLRYANSAIPFISAVVAEIVHLSEEHASIRTRLGEIDLHRHLDGDGDLYSDELRAVEESADQLCDRLKECYVELDQVSGIVCDPSSPAHVDFSMEVPDGTIHFCWRLGENRVSHWHWSNELCELRRPIVGFDELTDLNRTLLT